MSAAQQIDYEALEASKNQEVRESLTLQLKAKSKEAGRVDGLKRSILSFVSSENYELARDSLNAYIAEKNDFPLFQERSERYLSHCLDLIQAIELKRNFPGVSSLSYSKQQEIHEGVIKHFEELKGSLGHLQRIERELKLEDLRSTTWFLKTLSHCLFFITSVAFVLALQNGMGRSFIMIVDQLTDQVSSAVIYFLGL